MYFVGLARHAVSAGLVVKVVNPWQVRAFATSRLTRTKTDKVDAAVIREFGERMADRLAVWWPMPEALERVSVLVRFGDGLLRTWVAAGNRQHALGVIEAEIVREMGRGVKVALSAERDRAMAMALEIAREDELVGGWLQRLRTLPGFGDVSALRLMAYSGDFRRFGSGRQFAAYSGLVPRFKQSGGAAEVGTMSRMGSPALRSVLYWAAISAGQSRSNHGDFYRELRRKGKPAKVALVAVANRLARAAWAVCVRSSA